MPIMVRQADGSYAKIGTIIVGEKPEDRFPMFEQGVLNASGEDNDAAYQYAMLRTKREYAYKVPEGAKNIAVALTLRDGIITYSNLNIALNTCAYSTFDVSGAPLSHRRDTKTSFMVHKWSLTVTEGAQYYRFAINYAIAAGIRFNFEDVESFEVTFS